jgi:uncharacterized glyoxalase superfamily protein PhnB
VYEQLDDAVQAVLAHVGAPPKAAGKIAPLVRLAAQLRGLPRASFRDRLRSELQARIQPSSNPAVSQEEKMATTIVSPIPAGYRTITPYIVVQRAAELIAFVKQAFGAEEKFRSTGSAGGIHCEVQVGDSMMMIGGGGAWKGTPMPTAIHLYVEDADAAYERAMQAGATTLQPPMDKFYGDREGNVQDPFGNHWYIATHKATGRAPQGMPSVTPYLLPREPKKVIDFLQRAFGAEELGRAESEGVVHHARLRMGTSTLEMGQAHPPFNPMPTMFYLYVEDVDTLYARALAVGATSIHAPADQSYGDRSGGVTDPFGNQWYIATHIKDVTP